MDSNMAIDYRNPTTVRKIGMAALNKELGPVSALYILCDNLIVEKEIIPLNEIRYKKTLA